MDLRQALITVLALVATASGFIPTRKTRPRFFQHQGRNPSISLVTNLSGHGRQQPPISSNGVQPSRGINHRFTINGAPRKSKGTINIISNIILHAPTGQPGHQTRQGNPNSNQGPSHGPSQGQGHGQPQNHGQGHGHGQGQGRGVPGGLRGSGGQRMSSRRGNPNTVLRRVGGARNRYPLNNGQQAHGRSILDVLATRGGNLRGSGLSHAILPIVGSGHGHFGPAIGHGHGHGPVAQITLPVMNNTGLFSLLQAAHRSGNATSSTGAKGGHPQQLVLLPQLSSNGALVLSADTGAGYPHSNQALGSNANQGHSLVSGGSQHVMTTMKPPTGPGFMSISTLKPGEDPPEIEGPSF